MPATVPPSGTLPATIAPPTTAAAGHHGGGSGGGRGRAGDVGRPGPQVHAGPEAGPDHRRRRSPRPPRPRRTTQPPRQSWGESEVVQIIRSVFPDDIEEHALFIANRESRFDPYARNFCCTGLFQIYGSVHEKLINSLGFTVDQLTDPLVNSVVALAIYQRSGWAPWGG